jgi:hypothetical protein
VVEEPKRAVAYLEKLPTDCEVLQGYLEILQKSLEALVAAILVRQTLKRI